MSHYKLAGSCDELLYPAGQSAFLRPVRRDIMPVAMRSSARGQPGRTISPSGPAARRARAGGARRPDQPEMIDHERFDGLLSRPGDRAEAAAASPFSFREIGPTGLELSEGGKPVFVYNFGMVLAPGFPEAMRRSSYLHPVYAPDGTLLTDDFNADHPHHRGISWMWPEVTVDGKKGDIWMVKGFSSGSCAGRPARRATAARLAVENGWFDGERKFVDEEVEIVTHRPRRAADAGVHAALRGHRPAGPDRRHAGGGKGFGGFCFRFAPRDGGAAKTVIRTDQGSRPRTACCRGTRGPRSAAPSRASRPAPGRRRRRQPRLSAQRLAVAARFRLLERLLSRAEPITLEPGKPLVLKYRVLLFAGESPVAAAGGSGSACAARPRGG